MGNERWSLIAKSGSQRGTANRRDQSILTGFEPELSPFSDAKIG
jgi:hypothetical protein